MHILDTPIDFLKGVGPARADLLKKKLRIFTYSDLLMHYPFRYIDKSKMHKTAELNQDMPYVQLSGQIIKFEEIIEEAFLCVNRSLHYLLFVCARPEAVTSTSY